MRSVSSCHVTPFPFSRAVLFHFNRILSRRFVPFLSSMTSGLHRRFKAGVLKITHILSKTRDRIGERHKKSQIVTSSELHFLDGRRVSMPWVRLVECSVKGVRGKLFFVFGKAACPPGGVPPCSTCKSCVYRNKKTSTAGGVNPRGGTRLLIFI